MSFGFDRFKASPLGCRVGAVLSDANAIRGMERASEDGEPALLAVAERLLPLGRRVTTHAVRRHIGRWIGEILRARGWHPVGQGLLPPDRLCATGAIYGRAPRRRRRSGGGPRGLDRFKQSPLGRQVAAVLEHPESLKGMEVFSAHGEPAVHAIGKQLLDLGEGVAAHGARRHIGRWVGELLAQRGLRPVRQGRVPPGNLFATGAVYGAAA